MSTVFSKNCARIVGRFPIRPVTKVSPPEDYVHWMRVAIVRSLPIYMLPELWYGPQFGPQHFSDVIFASTVQMYTDLYEFKYLHIRF